MLQPKFNQYPKPTDWKSALILIQQAFESGFRASTADELAQYLQPIIGAGIGSGIEPTAEVDSTLPAPVQVGRIMIMKGGNYTQPDGTTPLIAPANSFNVGYWDGEEWSIPISIETEADLSGYVEKSGIKHQDFEFSDNVDVFLDTYINETAYPTPEPGAMYIEFPYEPSQNVIYEGVTGGSPGTYWISHAYLNALGDREGIRYRTGDDLSLQPYNLVTGVSGRVKIRINIFRPQQEGVYDFSNFKLYNADTGEVYARYRPAVTEILGRPIEPSPEFKGIVLKKSDIRRVGFHFASHVEVFHDMFANETAYPHPEKGSVYIEIPYSAGQSVVYEGVTGGGAGTYWMSSAYLLEDGTRQVIQYRTGDDLGSQPVVFRTNAEDRVKIRINIWRPQQEGVYDYTDFKIWNENTGEVYAEWAPSVYAIDGRELEPSQAFKKELEFKRDQLSSRIHVAAQLGVQNYPVQRVTVNNRRFDHGMVKRTTDDLLVCVHSYFFSAGGDFQPSQIAVTRSLNDGRTWGSAMVKPLWGGLPDVEAESNPDTVTNINGDVIVLFNVKTVSDGEDRAIAKTTLSADGLTWGPVELLTPFDGSTTGGSGGYIRANGDIYMPYYKRVSSGGGGSGSTVAEGRCLISTDGGDTFADAGWSISDTNPDMPTVFEPGVYGIGGNSLIYYYRTLQGYCRARRSDDLGATWGPSFNLFKAANSLSCVKRLSGLDNNLLNRYLAVCNPIEGAISSHTQDRRNMALLVSNDGLNFKKLEGLFYQYNGTKIAFEPNIFEDRNTGKLMIAWSADTNGIDLYCGVLSVDTVM